MPELPEVETVVRTLRPALRGRAIRGLVTGRNARKLRLPWNDLWFDRLRSRRIVGVRRRGKWIILDIEGLGDELGDDLSDDLGDGEALLVHLGMTGRLQVVPRRRAWAPHAHLGFALEPGKQLGDEELRFEDVRRFGCVCLVPRQELDAFFVSAGLGPEPFALTGALLFARLRKTRRSLKAVLLDQGVIAGVGNIYADESLFEAKLHPARPARELTRAEAGRLRRAVVKVLTRAIDKNGATIRDYVDGNGRAGGYQREFRVYDRAGEPCTRCRTPIARIRLAGRSTHFCPRCQVSVVRGP